MAILLIGSQLFTTRLYAQTVDSTAYVSISSELQRSGQGEGKVVIKQSAAIARLIESNALYNQRNQSMQGWRIRIYKDNSQNARSVSENRKNEFKSRYPDVGAYRSYDYPYFTVVVGDFRTPDDAERFLRRLKSDYREYSNAWPVTDKINFPPL